jgi:hypothetical protein
VSGRSLAVDPHRQDHTAQTQSEKRDGRDDRSREESGDSKRHQHGDYSECSTRNDHQAAYEHHDPVEGSRVHTPILAAYTEHMLAFADISDDTLRRFDGNPRAMSPTGS